MLRTSPFPLMIGDSVDPTAGRTRFNRVNYFFHNDGVHYMKEVPQKGDKGSAFTEPPIYARGEGTELPSWMIYDKMVLAFEAYLREKISEFMGYNYLIRKCKIYFFLEDGTIKVTEIKDPKSPFPQVGCIIGRQRIKFPPTGNSDDYFDVVDFNVGKSVELLGRTFQITNCDAFTRIFLNRLGISVPDALPTPVDPFETLRKQEEGNKKKVRERKKKVTLDEFLAMDSRILCFDGYWDDTQRSYGYVHVLKILYFLFDDSIEIKDITEKGKTVTLIKKGRLPKEPTSMVCLGGETPVRYLNVIGVGVNSTRTMIDSTTVNSFKEYYSDRDLTIGTVIDAYGKRVVLTNCDKFTQEYYRMKYGLDNFTPLQRPLTEEEESQKTLEKISIDIPPYNGFGTYEDSELNCLAIIPSTIIKSYKKFYEKDKQGYDSRVLRYSAKLISDNKDNDRRNFIICYYIVDDTVSVYETAKDCYDCLSAAMMTRRRMFKPGQEMYGSKIPEYYCQNDFFLGNIVTLDSHKFLLTSADEYAYKYMELHPNEFPKSNINLIMDKIREKVRGNYKNFAAQFFCEDKIPPANYHTLRKALKEVFNEEITEQEMITVARYYNMKQNRDKFSLETLRRCTHDELKRQLYDDYERLKESMQLRDLENVGRISREDAYTVMRGARLPLDTALINTIINKFTQGDKCEIVYEDLLNFLNYKKYPSTPLTPINIPGNMSWLNLYKPDNNLTFSHIDVEKFLEKLSLEEELKNQS